MPNKALPAERPPDQFSLNSYLGTRDSRPHQRSLASLWTHPPQPRSQLAPSPDMAQDDVKMLSQDEDNEMQVVKRPVNGNKKKRTIAIASSDVEDEDGGDQPGASSSSPVVKKRSKVDEEEEKPKSSPTKKSESSAATKAKIQSPAPSSSKSPAKPAASSSAKAKVADKSSKDNTPPVSSFFAPRSTKAAAEKGKEMEKKDLKGKAKATDDGDRVERERDDSPSVRGGDDDEEDEDEEAEEEAAGKIAEIFTMKAASSDKTQISWKSGDPVPYAALTATFDKIDATTKRLEISAYLTRFLVDVIEKTPGDLLKTVYLCINR
ncbi:hypothetical protein JCM5296_001868, partial [Sporobolomyces johnsonii]